MNWTANYLESYILICLLKNYLSDVSYNVLYDDFKKEADEDNEDEDIDAYMKKVYYEVNTKLNFPIGRPTRQEREQTIYALYERGFFNLKDSIDFVSKKIILLNIYSIQIHCISREKINNKNNIWFYHIFDV